MEDSTYLTTEEIARRLRVTDQTILAYLKAGHLRGVRLGRLWRVRPSDLDEFLAARSNRDEWGRRFDDLLTRIQAHVPPGLTEEEVDADAAAAVAEVREELRARRR